MFDNSAFNQDISRWNIDKVTTFYGFLSGASSFEQDLGWYVDADVNLSFAFAGTKCEITSARVPCGVTQSSNC